MDQIEQNVKESFKLVKTDIIKMQNLIANLIQNQERMLEWMNETKEKESKLSQKVDNIKAKNSKAAKKITASNTASFKIRTKSKKSYVASKLGKKVHEKNCPFAKNIKPKRKIVFHSKAKAFNLGFKACDCIKRI